MTVYNMSEFHFFQVNYFLKLNIKKPKHLNYIILYAEISGVLIKQYLRLDRTNLLFFQNVRRQQRCR